MSNVILTSAIRLVARIVLGSGIFEVVLSRVREWADRDVTIRGKVIEPEKKRELVLDELRDSGIDLGNAALNLGIELAVQLLKLAAK